MTAEASDPTALDPGDEPVSRLAAIVFGRDEAPDEPLIAFVEGAIADGARVAGLVQERADDDLCDRHDVQVRDLLSGETLPIMQISGRRPPAAPSIPRPLPRRRVCSPARSTNPDLLVVNRFGRLEFRAEAAGRDRPRLRRRRRNDRMQPACPSATASPGTPSRPGSTRNCPRGERRSKPGGAGSRRPRQGAADDSSTRPCGGIPRAGNPELRASFSAKRTHRRRGRKNARPRGSNQGLACSDGGWSLEGGKRAYGTTAEGAESASSGQWPRAIERRDSTQRRHSNCDDGSRQSGLFLTQSKFAVPHLELGGARTSCCVAYPEQLPILVLVREIGGA